MILFVKSLETFSWAQLFKQDNAIHRITQLVPLICGLSLLLVLSFAPIGFSAATPVFPSPRQKPTFRNSNSTRNQVDEEPLSGYVTFKSLFIIYLFILWVVIYSADSTIQHLNVAESRFLIIIISPLASVVQTLDSAIRRINHYPANTYWGNQRVKRTCITPWKLI